MEKKAKTLVYKIATGARPGSTLQEDLVAALRAKPMAKSRVEKLGINQDEARLINETRLHSTMFCGALQRFTAGAAQIIISIDEAATEWPIEQLLPPPTAKAKHREFIDGLLFFGIWKNHVVLLQSSACRASQFEDYLNWLFNPTHDVSGASEANSGAASETREPIMLNDLVPGNIRAEPYENVEKITLLSGLESKIMAPRGGASIADVRSRKFTPTKEVWKAIRGIFKQVGADVLDEIPLDSALNDSDIKVRLELFCSKKAAMTAGPVMNQLATSLRNVDEDVYKVQLSNGLELKGENLKVSKLWTMECANNVPVMQQLHRCMFDYLKELIDTGVVVT